MTTTLTVKQVSERLAQKLRARAARNHRSLQGELMAILSDAVAQPNAASEPPSPAYEIRPAPAQVAAHGRKLTLQELWERSRRLGTPAPSESAAIVRALRDERHGR